MSMINRRALMALAAMMAAAPAFAQENAAAAAEGEAPATPVGVKDFAIGQADAPIKMIEYASFTCPHCANFHATVYKQLKTEYIDTGKVHFTFREVYFDRYGLWAALVARCGGDMKYFGIADMLFNQQGDWAAQSDPTQVVSKLRTIGLSAGLTNEQLDACLADAAQVEAMVKHFETNMEADQVTGTPTLMIDGEKHPNMSYADLKTLLDKKLGG